MTISSVSSGMSQILQLAQLDRQFSSQVAERAQKQTQIAEATVSALLNTKIEASQAAVKASGMSLKGARVDVYA
ncbi:MAG: hypothetical protein KGZ83_06180 [Sulfuricella sp.]|nr:hypothetical protein [Sulfuricella sp.]